MTADRTDAPIGVRPANGQGSAKQRDRRSGRPYPRLAAQARLLVVEDDAAIAEPLTRALRRDGYDVDVCRHIRRTDADLPVVMLTARTEELDAVVGLDAGADDYVTKPFRLAELLARVRAHLRRRTDDVVTAGAVKVDVGSRRAWVDDDELTLTPKEFDLLALLVREAGHVVTRERIMSDVWDEHWFRSTKTLDMHVSSLRRKLGDDAAAPRFISTVRGVGLRFERE
jgi:DNA-binding response OmpR family regulator